MAPVLLVEDQRDARELLRMVLEFEGIPVVPAADGLEAIEVVRTERPCLIITDLMMPRMDGWQLVRHLAAQGDPIPVIVVSGVADLPEQARALGADAWFSKPVDPDALLFEVRRLMAA